MKKITKKQKKSFEEAVNTFLLNNKNYILIKKYEDGNSYLVSKNKKLKVLECGTKSIFQNLERTIEKEFFILFSIINVNILELNTENKNLIGKGMRFIEWYPHINLIEVCEQI